MNKFEILAGLMALPITANARLAIFWLFQSFNSKDPAYITWMGDKALAEKLNCSLSTAKRAIAEVIRLHAGEEPIFRHEIISNEELFARTKHRPKKDQGRGNTQNTNRFLTLQVSAAMSVTGDTGILSLKSELGVTDDTDTSVTDDTDTSVTDELRTLEGEPLNVEPLNGKELATSSLLPSPEEEGGTASPVADGCPWKVDTPTRVPDWFAKVGLPQDRLLEMRDALRHEGVISFDTEREFGKVFEKWGDITGQNEEAAWDCCCRFLAQIEAQDRRQSLAATEAKAGEEERRINGRKDEALGWLRYQEEFKDPKLRALRGKVAAGEVLDDSQIGYVLSKMVLSAV